MESLCGADCTNCGYGKNNNCKGCSKTDGCPFGRQCFIAKYILTGGKENYELFKKQLVDEINELNISGMPKISDLIPLNGSFVNLSYPLPNGQNAEFLNNDDIYLGTQVECEFNDGNLIRCFGVVVNMDFILISEYGPNGDNPEIIVYKKR
ncbi:MAG: DUF3795 domain-containing protein [Clostridia bacterium]|nr:DUF3795 domain-containing protein [Clostridia bacterium]